MSHEKPAAQVAFEEVSQDLRTEEDRLAYIELGQELNDERMKALGGPAVKTQELTVLPNGTVASEAEVQAAQEAGQEMQNAAYNNGRRG